jgi:multidrug efflux pump subunit AcrB
MIMGLECWWITVVVENVYRLMDEEGVSRVKAAKVGIGDRSLSLFLR